MIISLIGMPGAGKTTVGRHLAKRIGCQFFDSDQLIEDRLGMPISAYFASNGEESFRVIESETIREFLSAQSSSVLSTGGGCVTRECNRLALHSKSFVVYLRVPPNVIFKRIEHDERRPLLQVSNPRKVLDDLFAVRDPLYKETAHCVIEAVRQNVVNTVNLIQMQAELANIL